MPIKSVIQLESLGHNGNHSLLSGDDIKPSLNLITFYESESATKTDGSYKQSKMSTPITRGSMNAFWEIFKLFQLVSEKTYTIDLEDD